MLTLCSLVTRSKTICTYFYTRTRSLVTGLKTNSTYFYTRTRPLTRFKTDSTYRYQFRYTNHWPSPPPFLLRTTSFDISISSYRSFSYVVSSHRNHIRYLRACLDPIYGSWIELVDWTACRVPRIIPYHTQCLHHTHTSPTNVDTTQNHTSFYPCRPQISPTIYIRSVKHSLRTKGVEWVSYAVRLWAQYVYNGRKEGRKVAAVCGTGTTLSFCLTCLCIQECTLG